MNQQVLSITFVVLMCCSCFPLYLAPVCLHAKVPQFISGGFKNIWCNSYASSSGWQIVFN